MKLTKAKLISNLTPCLQELGYLWFKDSISPFQGLYAKKVGEGMFLTLGLTISKYYDDLFTGSFYLSRTTRIGCIWGDIPYKSYVRPGLLLDDMEIVEFRNENSIKNDLWWKGLIPSSTKNFISCLILAENKLLGDEELHKQIICSSDVDKLYADSHKTIDIVDKIPIFNFKYLPVKCIDNIPKKWFMAAEYILSTGNGVINKNTVKDLAADAYRQFVIGNS